MGGDDGSPLFKGGDHNSVVGCVSGLHGRYLDLQPPMVARSVLHLPRKERENDGRDTSSTGCACHDVKKKKREKREKERNMRTATQYNQSRKFVVCTQILML